MTKRTRHLLTESLSALVFLAFIAWFAFEIGEANEATGIPPCEYEDSLGPCYWDASERGNGEGNDFWVDHNNTIHTNELP